MANMLDTFVAVGVREDSKSIKDSDRADRVEQAEELDFDGFWFGVEAEWGKFIKEN